MSFLRSNASPPLRPRVGCAVLALTMLGWPAAARGAPDGGGLPAEAAPQAADPGSRPAAGPRTPLAGGGRPRLLSVPYLPQEELLCGSAAAAMVMRYWGGRADARHFADLVDPARHGIGTEELVDGLRGDGWHALPFAATADRVRRHLRAGRPVIALVQDGADRYHYVVVVAWVDGKVVFHDPAVGPFEVRPEVEFLGEWEPAGNWALLVLPGSAGSPGARQQGGDEVLQPGRKDLPQPGTEEALHPGVRPEERKPEGRPNLRALLDRRVPLGPAGEDPAAACTSLVEAGVAAARADDPTTAERRLGAAVAVCPGRPEALRELAGLRFRQERWADATRLARRALAISPDDPYTWRLLAGARFLGGDRDGALEAWSRRGEPRVEAVEIRGVRRTRHPVIADALELRAEDVLTRDRLERGRRRLAALPTMSLTRLRYEAPTDGRSTVVAAVVEQPLLPASALEIAAAAGRSLARREISIELAGPTGEGVVWEPWWRWTEGNSGIGLRVDLPAPAGIGGVWSLRTERTEETLGATAGPRGAAAPRAAAAPESRAGSESPEAASTPASTTLRRTEVRDHVGLEISDWSSGHTRWEVRSGWDRWHDRGRYLFLGGSVERRLVGDRLAVTLESTGWEPLGPDGGPFAKAGGFVAWRSSAADSPSAGWLGVAGLEAVVGDPPPTLWPGAGVGEARQPLLRAHPLLSDGSVRGDALGRRLVHTTVEYRRRLAMLGPLGLVGAGFADAARTWDPPEVASVGSGATPAETATSPSDPRVALPSPARTDTASGGPGGRFHVDVGIGLRLRLPGESGSLRVDVARGLRDAATSLSAGWQVAWPGWRR